MYTNYAAIECMSKEKGGEGGIIVNTASVLGLDKMFSMPAYVATKHAVIGFTRCLGVSYPFFFFISNLLLVFIYIFFYFRMIFIIKFMVFDLCLFVLDLPIHIF